MARRSVISRATRYAKAGSLSGAWALMSTREKRYAAYLVSRYGWRANLAIQRAYIFGYDEWTYDRRAHKAVKDDVPAWVFGY